MGLLRIIATVSQVFAFVFCLLIIFSWQSSVYEFIGLVLLVAGLGLSAILSLKDLLNR